MAQSSNCRGPREPRHVFASHARHTRNRDRALQPAPLRGFLETIGLNVGPLPLLVHFGYGATWSLVLVVLYGRDASIGKGIGLALVLWLIMMVAYAPIMGWGLFGFGGTGHELAPTNPLYLGSPVKYVGATLVLHLIYGTIIGGLNSAWIPSGASEQTAAGPESNES